MVKRMRVGWQIRAAQEEMGRGTFNISTAVAFVAAGGGCARGKTWQSLCVEPVRQR